MTEREQIIAFEDALWKTVKRFRAEFQLTVGAGIGVLEVVKLRMWQDALTCAEEDDPSPYLGDSNDE